MSLGVRDSAEIAVRAGIRHSLFAVRPETDALAIDRYLESLEPIPSPYLVDGGLGTGAQRGERIFQEVRCARCHNGPNFTNGKMYDVGTGLGPERSMKFDTPTLIEVWRTAAYLHDGRAATIRDVLTVFNHDDRHGRTSKLSESQITDLVEYVLTR